MFIPGETIVHSFVIPFGKPNLDTVVVTYKQNDHIILERSITSSDVPGFENYTERGVVIEGKTKITVQLSQEESLLFEDVKNFTIQLNVYSPEGARLTSHEIKSSNGVQHHREVI